jgi:DNA ligase 1
MTHPWEVISQLESTNSRLAKEAVLRQVSKEDNTVFFRGCQLACDPMITFGIKTVPESKTDGAGLSWDEFLSVVELFMRRALTGNAAQLALNGIMTAATQEQWNGWYRRILIKDLRCGITETTINKVRPDTVPVFSCQLAKDASDHESKIKGPKLLDYKLDGVRVLAVVRRGAVTLHSRNGKIFENFKHIEAQLSAASKDLEADWVLDGEITSDSFQTLMTQVHRKRDADASDAVFNVFDLVPLESFLNGKDDMAQKIRSANLRDFMGHIRDANCENIRALDYKEVDLDTEEGMEMLHYMRNQAKDLGLEGVMVKDADAPYECKRTTAWLKMKPFIEVTLEVKGIEEGTGRNVGRLGAFICEGEDDGRSIRVNVGSGFSDRQRDVYWGNDLSIVGQKVEIRADAVTQNQDGSYSLRFPRFLRFRGFEPGEKL